MFSDYMVHLLRKTWYNFVCVIYVQNFSYLQAAEYRENKIHTGWLDSRIAMRVRAERPPWYLSVVAGALYEASSRSSSVVTDYVGYLSKGQIPPKVQTI